MTKRKTSKLTDFEYIESRDALFKQRTGKLFNSFCPKPHLRNIGSRKLLNFGFFFMEIDCFSLV